MKKSNFCSIVAVTLLGVSFMHAMQGPPGPGKSDHKRKECEDLSDRETGVKRPSLAASVVVPVAQGTVPASTTTTEVQDTDWATLGEVLPSIERMPPLSRTVTVTPFVPGTVQLRAWPTSAMPVPEVSSLSAAGVSSAREVPAVSSVSSLALPQDTAVGESRPRPVSVTPHRLAFRSSLIELRAALTSDHARDFAESYRKDLINTIDGYLKNRFKNLSGRFAEELIKKFDCKSIDLMKIFHDMLRFKVSQTALSSFLNGVLCKKALLVAPDKDRNNALHVAAKFNPAMLRFLLSQMTPEEVRRHLFDLDINDETPVLAAIRCGARLEVIQFLFSQMSPEMRYAVLQACNVDGDTPLHLAIADNRNDPALVEFLVNQIAPQERPAILGLVNEDGDSPLTLSAGFNDEVEIIKFLLNQLPVADRDEVVVDLIYDAAEFNTNLEVLQFLLGLMSHQGVLEALQIANDDDQTSLDVAENNVNPEVHEYLLGLLDRLQAAQVPASASSSSSAPSVASAAVSAAPVLGSAVHAASAQMQAAPAAGDDEAFLMQFMDTQGDGTQVAAPTSSASSASSAASVAVSAVPVFGAVVQPVAPAAENVDESFLGRVTQSFDLSSPLMRALFSVSTDVQADAERVAAPASSAAIAAAAAMLWASMSSSSSSLSGSSK